MDRLAMEHQSRHIHAAGIFNQTYKIVEDQDTHHPEKSSH